jgi:hypothetical protein
MAELGQTTDPKALIPGAPETVEDHAKKLTKLGERFDEVGNDLKKIDVGGWTGPASEAFTGAFSKEPPKWLKSSDILADISRALTDHAGTLTWAQSQAAEAIALWQEGEEASQKAAAQHNAAVDEANKQNQANAAAGSQDTVTAGAFSDPGEKLRKEAQELLTRAREQLDQGGQRTASAIAGQDPNAGGGALGGLVEAVTSGWKGEGKAEASGPDAGVEMSGPGKGSLGEIRAFAELGKASAEGKIGNDLFNMEGKAEAMVGAEATASASFTGTGVEGQAEVFAGAKASAEGSINAGPVGVNGSAEGMAGANAGVNGSVGKDGVNLGAEAFAGAKGSVEGGADIGGIGVSGTAEGWAGAGAEAGVDMGMNEEGKFEIGANAGAAVGLGGELGFKVTVDPDKVTKTVGDAAGAVGDAAGAVGNTVSGWVS